MKKMITLTLSLLMMGVMLLSCASGNSMAAPSSDRDQTEGSREEILRRSFLARADEVTVTETAVTFTDGLGRTVTAPKNPQKTVILYTSFTTLWYEAGGEVIGCIGGNTATSLYRDYIGRDITQDSGVTAVSTASAIKASNSSLVYTSF